MPQSVNLISTTLAIILFSASCGQTSPFSIAKPNTISDLHSEYQSSSRPSYDEIVSELESVAKKHANIATIVSYGKSVQGRTLTAIRFENSLTQASGQKRPVILISEGIHGNEYLNISDRLPSAFTDGNEKNEGFREFLSKGGIVYVVPILNPDAFERNERANANGKDLNRDFPLKARNHKGFTQPETKAIHDMVKKDIDTNSLVLEMTMEYHCCAPGLIYPWNHDVDRELEGDQATRRDKLLDIFTPIFPNYIHGNVKKVVNYPEGDVGGSDDFYLETYGRMAYSFEGAQGVEHRNLDKHVTFWNKVFSQIAKDYMPTSESNGTPYIAIHYDKILISLDKNQVASHYDICRVDELFNCVGTKLNLSSVVLNQFIGPRKVGRIDSLSVSRSGVSRYSMFESIGNSASKQIKTWEIKGIQ